MSTSRLAAWLLGAAALSFAAIPSYVVQTIAGSSYVGDGGPATKALLQTVEGVAADSLGNYYLADTASHTIRRVSPKGIITTIAGTGIPGFSGDGGPATAAQLNLPYGLVTDYAGNLYVADFGNHCIRKITPDGLISTIAGLTTSTQMSGPRNLALDSAGNLYISDFNLSRVYRLSPQLNLTVIAGSPTATALGDNGLATLAQLQNPAGIAVDQSANIYISDTGNKRVRMIAPNGIITTVGVSVSTPVGLAMNAANQLFIADAGAGIFVRVSNPASATPVVKAWPQNCRDVAVDNTGNTLLAFGNTVTLFNGLSSFKLLAGGNNFFFAGDEGSALFARLNQPLGLARDTAGDLYIADSGNGRVRRVTPNGVIHTFISGLISPAGLNFDPATGRLYIADAGSHSILIAKPDGTILSRFGNGKGFAGDGGSVISARFNAPSGIAYDPVSGNIYISDEGNNCVRVVTPSGQINTLATMPSPAGIAVDGQGVVYVAQSATGLIVKLDASGNATPVSNAGVWITPRGLAIDSTGALYVTDIGTQRITRIAADGTVSLVAGTGQAGFTGDSGPGSLAAFSNPAGVAVDPLTGSVYVSDSGNNRVRELSITTASPTTAAPLQLISFVNAASLLPGPVAPGELVTILGTGVEADDIQLNATPVTPVSTAPGAVTIAVPDAAGDSGTIELQLLSNGSPIARVTAALAPLALGVFAGMILNQDGTVNSTTNPAERGTAITIYGTGEGRDGVSVAATLDGQLLDVASFGPSPDNANMFMLVAYVPSGYFPAGSMKLLVTSGASTSQAGVFVWIQ